MAGFRFSVEYDAALFFPARNIVIFWECTRRSPGIRSSSTFALSRISTIQNQRSSEVFKYVLKFSTMPLDVNHHASRVLAGRRLLISVGDFWGVKVPSQLTDEPLEMEHIDYYFEWLDGQYKLMEVMAEI